MAHTVLVCDDAIFMRTMVGDILTQAGFEIVGEADDGESAVERIASLKPDLVFLDIGMPGRSGYDVARALRDRHGDALSVAFCAHQGQVDCRLSSPDGRLDAAQIDFLASLPFTQRVGDLLCFDISHPCLTFDKWQVGCLVDEQLQVIESLETRF